jgi:acyl-CoA oxidase
MEDQVARRAQVLRNHLATPIPPPPTTLSPSHCLSYSPPDLTEPFSFNTTDMRALLDSHHLADRDWLFGLMIQSRLFNPLQRGAQVFVSPDYNQSMEQQREATMRRIDYLQDKGVYQGWLTDTGPEAELRRFAFYEVVGIYDHSLAVKLGVHFFLWYVNSPITAVLRSEFSWVFALMIIVMILIQ